jgi:hypothetical protein
MPQNDPYDDLDLGAEPFKPEEPNTSIVIRVEQIKPVQTKDGKSGAVVAGRAEDGTAYEWVAWNRNAKNELRRERPMPGDWLRITYLGRDAAASNPALAARLWKLANLRQNDDIPF